MIIQKFSKVATSGLGGIPETGMGIGLAQVLPKSDIAVPDIADFMQKQQLLGEKKKEEQKAKYGKFDYEAWQGFEPARNDLFVPKLNDYKKWYYENSGKLSPEEFNAQNLDKQRELKTIIEAAKDLKSYDIAMQNKVDEWTKQGYEVTGTDEYIKLFESPEYRKQIFDKYEGDPNAIIQEYGKIISGIEAKPKVFDYLKAWQPVQVGATEYTTEKEAEAEGGSVWKTNTGKYVNQASIEKVAAQELNNANSMVGQAALAAHGGDFESALKELTERKMLQYGRRTGETITEKAKGGGSGALTEKDIIENQKYTATIPGKGTMEQESPASLVLPSNEILNIPISTDIIDRSTGTGMSDVTGQLNISGGVINIIKVKRAGKEIYEPQLFATGTDVAGNKYDVQIPLDKIKNTIKRHDQALTALERKADEINRRKDKPKEGEQNEIERLDKKTNKVAVFDAKTKKFKRWK